MPNCSFVWRLEFCWFYFHKKMFLQLIVEGTFYLHVIVIKSLPRWEAQCYFEVVLASAMPEPAFVSKKCDLIQGPNSIIDHSYMGFKLPWSFHVLLPTSVTWNREKQTFPKTHFTLCFGPRFCTILVSKCASSPLNFSKNYQEGILLLLVLVLTEPQRDICLNLLWI